MRRALILSPNASITEDAGPSHAIPASSTRAQTRSSQTGSHTQGEWHPHRSPGNRQDLLTVEVRRRSIVPAQRERLVGLARMGSSHVLIGIDRNRGNAHVGGRSAHTQGDFATVGDEDSVNCSHASPWCCERVSGEYRSQARPRRQSGGSAHRHRVPAAHPSGLDQAQPLQAPESRTRRWGWQAQCAYQ